MKKALILLALIFLMNTGFAQIDISTTKFETGKWKEYYSNGQLRATGEYVNKIMTGEWKLYYDDGKLRAIGKYDNDKPVPGTWKVYYKTGEINDCGCPPPSQKIRASLAFNIFQNQPADNPRDLVSYAYQEIMRDMACVDEKSDSFEVIKKKIQNLWKNYGELLIANNYPNSVASEKNVLKFSLDMGFTAFLTEMTKRYKIDMNFIDPGDGKTILDFIDDRIVYIRNAPPVDEKKASEYERIRDLLKKNGALHNYEITKSR